MSICCMNLFYGVHAQFVSDTIPDQVISEVSVLESRNSDNINSISSSQQMDYSKMKSANVLQLSDALKFFSGVAIKDYGGLGGLKTISVRGLGACHTAVAYDGIVQTDIQTGQIDLGRMSSLQIASIRLVEGIDNDILQPAVLSASATTLNVESKKPELLDEDKHIISTNLKYGSFNTLQAEVSMYEQINRKLMTSVSAEWLSSDGNYPYQQENGDFSQTLKRNNSDVNRLKTEVSLIADLSDDAHLNIKGYLFRSEQGLPSNILYNTSASTERIWNRDAFVQASFRNRINEHWSTLTNLRLSGNYSHYQNGSVNNSDGKTDNKYHQRELYASVAAMRNIGSYISISLAEDFRRSSLSGNGAEQVSPLRGTLNSALSLKFANDAMIISGQLNHIYSHETTKIRDAAEDNSYFSPAFGINYKLTTDGSIHLRASSKNTYRLPTFNDLYFEQIGRRDLRPEKATLNSAGIIWNFKSNHTDSKISIYADIFRNDITDRILAVPGKSTAIWMMKNIGKVVIKGIEAGLDLSSQVGTSRTGITGSYTYNRAMDKTDSESATYNHQIPYTPRHSGSCILYIENKYLNFSYNMFFSGEYYCNSYNGPQYLMPSYDEHGFSIWHNINTKDTEIQLKAELINLFDNRYEIVRNYPMPGTQGRISITINM